MRKHEEVLQEIARPDISVISLLNALLTDAFQEGASDVHIDPTSKDVQVRLRIDGQLRQSYTLPVSIHAELIARLKIMAGLRTDEHYAPQDGRYTLGVRESLVDVRVSIARSHYGENAVLRLLSNEMQRQSIASIGLSDQVLIQILEILDHGQGMILVAGPTGSGKTTTLYALLQELVLQPLSVVSIEDPIEYAIPGVRQFQVHSHTSFTFSNGLRSILRQDPDVLMVGEIRDAETASIAIHAAQTGHLVLSTIHATNTAGAIDRLSAMGISPEFSASAVQAVLTQRLVRRICDQCKEPAAPSAKQIRQLEKRHIAGDVVSSSLFAGSGCRACDNTGYKGRVGIFHLSSPVRSRGKHVEPSEERFPLLLHALEACRDGTTTLEEILRACYA